MCMSFYDVPLGRQEEIWVETIGYTQPGGLSVDFWLFRRDGYEGFLRETYAEMDTADLTAHKHELEEDHPQRDGNWAHVIDAVTDELKKRADNGSLGD